MLLPRSIRLRGSAAVLGILSCLAGAGSVEAQAHARQWVAAVPMDGNVLAVGVETDGRILLLWSPLPFVSYAPPAREWYEPREVASWVASVRKIMAAADERLPARRLPLDSQPVMGPRLGRRLYYQTRSKEDSLATLWVKRCDEPGANGHSTDRGATVALLDALSRAVDIATRDSASRSVDVGKRTYHRHEVSCEATPTQPIVPGYPEGIPRSERRPYVLPVEFVVDSTGAVDPTTVHPWPHANHRFVRVARQILARARFVPARRGGVAVRQVVDQVLIFEPMLANGASLSAGRMAVAPNASGWVALTYRPADNPVVVREWYAPDSIDRWLDTLQEVVREGQLPSRPSGEPSSVFAALGSWRQTSLWAGFAAVDSTLIRRSWALRGCGGWIAILDTILQRGPGLARSGSDGDTLIALSHVAAFRFAVDSARRRARSPIPPGRRVRDMTEVGCRASVNTDRAPLDEGVIRQGVRHGGFNAEVFAGFVVNRAGRVDTATIRVLPNADPAAVRLLRPTMAHWRFLPASRGGISVPQRVFLPVVFETGLPLGTTVVVAKAGHPGGTTRPLPVFPTWALKIAKGPEHVDRQLALLRVPPDRPIERSDIRAELAPLHEEQDVAETMHWPVLASTILPVGGKDIRIFSGLLIGYPHDALRIVETHGVVRGSWVRYWQPDDMPSSKIASGPRPWKGLDTLMRSDARGRCGPIRVGPYAIACEMHFRRNPDWAAVLASVEEARLWDLPDGQLLPRRVIDGWGMWVEARRDTTYRSYSYNNPGWLSTGDGRDAWRLMSEVDSLAPLIKPSPEYRPFRGYYLNGPGVSDFIPCSGGQQVHLSGDLRPIVAFVGDSVWKAPDRAPVLLYIEGGGLRVGPTRNLGHAASGPAHGKSAIAMATISLVKIASPSQCKSAPENKK